MDAQATQVGINYLQITMGTIIVLVGLFVCSGVLRGVGDSRTPMLATLLANVLNGILAYGLINGALGMPKMGAAGSAVAAFLARAFALLILLGVLWRGRNGVSIRGAGWRPDITVIKRVFNIGVPAAVEQVITTLAFVGLTVAVGRMLGTVTLAAHRITIAVMSIAFLPGFGFAIATTSLVGQAFGARRLEEIKPIARIAAIWAFIWMGVIGISCAIFAEPLLRLFTTDSAVIDAGLTGVRVAGLLNWIALPFTFVYAGALRGTGDSRSPLFVQGIGWWCATLAAWGVLALVPGSGLGTLWAVFSLIIPFMGVLMVRQLTKRMRVLQANPPEHASQTPA